MRVIKFRQWTGDRFYYWGLGVQDDGAYFTGPVSGGNLRVADQIHEQFTGLTDANCVEIYEGDILKITSKITTEIVIVGFWMGNWCFMFNSHEAGSPIYPTLINMKKEVIGNIHQNPELLESDNV